MADLRAFFVELGFADARTLLQTGNVVFDAGRQKVSVLEKLFRAEAQQRLGLETDFMLRSAVDWQSLIARNPFDQAAQTDPSHLVMMALSAAPTVLAVAELQAAIKGREVVEADGAQLYLIYPDGIGDSRLTNTVIERKLGVRGTGRNWNTVLKLAALIQS